MKFVNFRIKFPDLDISIQKHSFWSAFGQNYVKWGAKLFPRHWCWCRRCHPKSGRSSHCSKNNTKLPLCNMKFICSDYDYLEWLINTFIPCSSLYDSPQRIWTNSNNLCGRIRFNPLIYLLRWYCHMVPDGIVEGSGCLVLLALGQRDPPLNPRQLPVLVLVPKLKDIWYRWRVATFWYLNSGMFDKDDE